jgi:glycosyltransferase involved in cell wall biosynthesis
VRVLRVITRLNIGGPSIQAVTLSDRLREHGFATTLLHGQLGAGEGDMSDLLAGTHVDARYLPALQRPLSPISDLRAVHAVYRLMCETRPHIVHSHMAKAGTVARAAGALYNRTAGRHSPARLVHTYHGHVLEGYFSPTRTQMFLGIERALARVSDRLIAISPRVQADLLKMEIGTPGQYVVVPLGFDLADLARVDAAARARARERLQLPPGVPVITTVGRLTAIKQHDLFLRMANRVAAVRRDAVFLIAGDGELRGALEALTAELGLTPQLRFLGWQRDLATVYGATDVFALTSRNEGTPVALIEAMASGVPGVSTDVGGVGDVITSDAVGIRVPEGTAEALADAVLRLYNSPERESIGAEARRFVQARFSLERLVRDIANLYSAMLAH